MTELQPIDKWLLEEAVDSISYTGNLTIDYIWSHVSKEHSLYAKSANEDFKRLGIKETLYYIAKDLNLRFISLNCPVRASIIGGRLQFTFHNCTSVTDNTDEYMALHRAITARREEQERLNAIRTKKIGKNVKITITNSKTEAEKQRDEKRRDEERKLLLQK